MACGGTLFAMSSVFMNVHSRVHARDKVQVVQFVTVFEADSDRNNLSHFLEIARALSIGLGEQRENRRGAGLDFPDSAGDPGMGVGVNGDVD
jgi:hypothetical protein